ncbi:polysaccharide pyruvyl transferase family protein [Aquabacterium sp. A08]|uniref:polysaccharide pyruvyl transferase family protein n=1 Tax=Aquabacterium sp. A08 TaxID=2718532 RepID=UPI00141D938D|nr:polysaccharide pyruvyl transferase family protein [Aquabacterium sp. A08]NIC41997.1 polysaccharide pyruvyl transferase family protein [Aquabacterium sp. A08]
MKPRPISNWLKTNRFHPDHTYKAALKTLRSAEFVITDTYHLAINAINLGIPTIGIGLYQTEQVNTCADFKKKVLFEDLGIANFYIETQTSDIKESLDRILSNSKSVKNYNLATAENKKEIYAKQLTDTLTLPR